VGASTIARDIRERKAADEHQKALLSELDHRVKNTLTVVLSLAAQTAGQSKSLDDFLGLFEGRVLALSRAHQLLSTCRWQGGNIRDLVSRTLEPQMDKSANGRIRLEGPDIMLPPKVAVAFAMVFHELTTNAVKHGALRDASGSLAVEWKVNGTPEVTTLDCAWIETLKRPNESEFTPGFGLQLIEFAVRKDLGGEVNVDLSPQGLRARFHVAWPVGSRQSI
jgi:two-component sensor histidine kinase